MTFDYDLLVIGAGSGGVRASRVAAELGASVAIIEAGKLGGTCVNAGCIPKKLLVYGAEMAQALSEAPSHGFAIGTRTFSWPALVAAKDREIEYLNGVYGRLLAKAGVELIAGRAEVLGPESVRVDERILRARYLLIATGGVPKRLEVPGAEFAITSDEAFHLAALPERIVIVGAGYIGVEFAGIFHGLGSKAQVIFRSPHVLRGFDAEVREHLSLELRKQGIELREGKALSTIARSGNALSVTASDGSVSECDQVMLAVGRTPNTRQLGLDAAGVKLGDDGAVLIDAYGKTSVDSVYAVGDCTGRSPLTPVAIADGRAVAHTLFGKEPLPFDHALVPTAVFSQPQVATVGLTEAQARARGGDVQIYRTTFRPLQHALSGRGERTLVKLVVDKETDRVLGCHMVGSDAAEIIPGFAVALRCGATKSDFDATLGIHPTSAEEFVTLRGAG